MLSIVLWTSKLYAKKNKNNIIFLSLTQSFVLIIFRLIKTPRKLENGFSGKEECKDGFQSEGIECDDGYNYWLKTDHGKSGAAKKFITRAIDFKRRNAAR